jgi:hypothetical protein
MQQVDVARGDATRSSGAGVGFLVAYGATLLVSGILAFFLPLQIAALVILFQGGVALPIAFAIERLNFPSMDKDNPCESSRCCWRWFKSSLCRP